MSDSSTPSPTLAPVSTACRPDLSVVYINRGMGGMLKRSLESLRQANVALNLEVLVAHAPGRDPVELMAQCQEAWPGIHWIEHPRFGVALLRNVGIAQATGRYVMMLDADTLVPADSFERIVAFMDNHPEVGGCGPRTFHPDGTEEFSVRRFYSLQVIFFRRTILGRLWPDSRVVRRHLMLDCDRTRPLDIDWMAGACYVMRSEAISHVGNFDDSFFFGFEDVDWCYRAKLAGWQIAFIPGAKIIHDVQRSSARGLNRMALEHLKSALRFWRKHQLTPRPRPARGNSAALE